MLTTLYQNQPCPSGTFRPPNSALISHNTNNCEGITLCIMKILIAALSALLSSTAIADGLQQTLGAHPKHKQPNFIFVITDDQDLELDSVNYTPLIQTHLQSKGTFFRNHFVTTALCCPSRVSLWTGQQAHNTNVTDVSPPYGMYISCGPIEIQIVNPCARRLSEVCGSWLQ